MPRKAVYLLNVLFFLSAAVTLAIVNPLLSHVVVGFSAVYLSFLGATLFVHWVLGNRAARSVFGLFMAAGLFVTLTAMGHPGWGIFGAVLLMASLSKVRDDATAPAPRHPVMDAAGRVH